MGSEPVLRLTAEVTVESVYGQNMVYVPRTGHVHVLNELGHKIINMVSQGEADTLRQLSLAVCGQFPGEDPRTIEADVARFVEELRQMEILTCS